MFGRGKKEAEVGLLGEKIWVVMAPPGNFKRVETKRRGLGLFRTVKKV